VSRLGSEGNEHGRLDPFLELAKDDSGEFRVLQLNFRCRDLPHWSKHSLCNPMVCLYKMGHNKKLELVGKTEHHSKESSPIFTTAIRTTEYSNATLYVHVYHVERKHAQPKSSNLIGSATVSMSELLAQPQSTFSLVNERSKARDRQLRDENTTVVIQTQQRR